jgi:hypothetical protein
MTVEEQMGQLRAVFLDIAAKDTAYDPETYRGWLQGHCGPASFVVRLVFGGDIVQCRVEGERHFFNRLEDGSEWDLTSCQFGGDGIHRLSDWQLSNVRVMPKRSTTNPRFLLFFERFLDEVERRGLRFGPTELLEGEQS